VRDVLSTVVYPLHYLTRLPTDARNWLNQNLASRVTLLEENARCAKTRYSSMPSCRN
jgi:hypothetical protein